MKKYILISIGGFIGAILRYSIDKNPILTNFPINVFLVNIFGSLLLAFFLNLTLEYRGFNPNLRIGVTTGFFGALTTFSTFCKDTILLFVHGDYSMAILNVVLSIVTGLIFAYLGVVLAREILNRKRKQMN